MLACAHTHVRVHARTHARTHPRRPPTASGTHALTREQPKAVRLNDHQLVPDPLDGMHCQVHGCRCIMAQARRLKLPACHCRCRCRCHRHAKVETIALCCPPAAMLTKCMAQLQKTGFKHEWEKQLVLRHSRWHGSTAKMHQNRG